MHWTCCCCYCLSADFTKKRKNKYAFFVCVCVWMAGWRWRRRCCCLLGFVLLIMIFNCMATRERARAREQFIRSVEHYRGHITLIVICCCCKTTLSGCCLISEIITRSACNSTRFNSTQLCCAICLAQMRTQLSCWKHLDYLNCRSESSTKTIESSKAKSVSHNLQWAK